MQRYATVPPGRDGKVLQNRQARRPVRFFFYNTMLSRIKALMMSPAARTLFLQARRLLLSFPTQAYRLAGNQSGIRMLTHTSGYPRIGAFREMKRACEGYWKGTLDQSALKAAALAEKQYRWRVQHEAGIDLIACNDFSLYDHVQDMSFTLGAIPERYEALSRHLSDLDLYFAMCRGYQESGFDVTAMEMTKWFDTNYHYLVPEFTRDQDFHYFSRKCVEEFLEAKAFGVAEPKTVLIGPISYLLLGREKSEDFHRLDLIESLMPVYMAVLEDLHYNGDVSRKQQMTVELAMYAQSLTDKPVKGMLTGPGTILKWSFVRDDQPLGETAMQVALALRDEVTDLELAGIGIIQIDEPGIREGLPLKRADRERYLEWSVRAFLLCSGCVGPATQIHTHLCYADYGDILDALKMMDADVLTIETARSDMKVLADFAEGDYMNQLGPGIYDIHSPRIPSERELEEQLKKVLRHFRPEQIWVNPDCGLKTRSWDEVIPAIENMVTATIMTRRHLEKPPVSVG